MLSMHLSKCSCSVTISRRQRLAISVVPQNRTTTRSPALRSRNRPLCTASASVEEVSLKDAQAVPVGSSSDSGLFPDRPGVYAVYDSNSRLQYIGISRKVSDSIASHMQKVPDLVHTVRVAELADPSKEALTAAWRKWVEQAAAENNEIPPGNQQGSTLFSTRRLAKPEIKLTPGKGIDDLTCSVEDLIEGVVKTNKVVAFVKGTRTEPQCGFSHKVLTILNENRVDYEVVNVLDEVYNPGLREAIKRYSEWPTIPQVYVKGEFVGGADIVEEMHGSGELKKLLN